MKDDWKNITNLQIEIKMKIIQERCQKIIEDIRKRNNYQRF